ncbi:MAG: hypothetical protein Q4D76_18490 [Oscillospiraceae bacterium]|nr:hypothetical protein [Oscillospiraceae bacterium]
MLDKEERLNIRAEKVLAKNQYKEVSKKIVDAAKNGEGSIILDDDLLPEVYNLLKKRGFNIWARRVSWDGTI